MATTYTYTVTANFSAYNLSNNIALSTISTGGGLLGISFDGVSNLQVTFNAALSTGDHTTLGTLVTNNTSFVTPTLMITQYKYTCKYATTTAGTLATSFASGQTVDGNTLAVGDRILIKNQTNGIQNGIYYVTTGTPVRSSDLLNGYAAGGIVIDINLGSANGTTIMTCTNVTGLVPPTDIVGTNVLTFDFLTPLVTEYMYAWDNTTQTAAANQTFQILTFGHVPVIRGWTTNGSPVSSFTCNEPGIYRIIYEGYLITTSGANPQQTGTILLSTTAPSGAVGSGAVTEIVGSQTNTTTPSTNGIQRCMTQDLVYTITTVPLTIWVCFAATISGSPSNVTSIAPDGISLGTRVSLSMTITLLNTIHS